MGNLCASSRKSLVIISSDRASTSGSSTGGSSSNLGSSNENLSSNVGHPDGRILETSNLRIFTFAELRQATRNFKPETLIGEGGFGKVYKGWVDENTLNPTKTGLGIMIAVKKLKYESVQGLEEWQSEVTFLGRLSHPNLVKLLGYCWEDKELLLVYEYMSKGSLENHLFRKGEPLSWTLRLKILRGAAQGLAFLHSSEKQIIYRDFKASNILLDLDYSSKLSDFGLAKNGPTGEDSHVTTRVIGTYGYAAPEYVATGHLYVKSDVYGFGVVLLEMLTGRRALDLTKPNGEMNLVNWAKPFLLDRKKFARIMDPRLEGQYPSKAAFEAAQLTFRCIALDPRSRPSMQEVLGTLQKIEASQTKSKQKKNSPPNREQHSPMRHHRPSPRNDRRDLGSRPSHYKN